MKLDKLDFSLKEFYNDREKTPGQLNRQDPNDNSMLDMLIGYSCIQILILLLLLLLNTIPIGKNDAPPFNVDCVLYIMNTQAKQFSSN